MIDTVISQALRHSREGITLRQGDYFGDGSRLIYRDGEVSRNGDGKPLTDKGLLYCGKCGQLRQYRIYASFLKKVIEPYILCDCEQQKDQRERDRLIEENRQRRIGMNLSQADRLMLKNTFDADKYPDSEASRLFRDYCRRWKEEYLPKGMGLYIFGDIGVGKTFYASCIANEIARVYGDTVKAMSVTRALNDMFSTEDKSGFINELAAVDLLILDDFGVQRSTEYSSETVFSIIDERYKSQKPLILTGNLDYGVIKQKRSHDRVYDRVIDMCIPYRLSGRSKRGIQI